MAGRKALHSFVMTRLATEEELKEKRMNNCAAFFISNQVSIMGDESLNNINAPHDNTSRYQYLW
jgi:hypothetical protein